VSPARAAGGIGAMARGPEGLRRMR